VSDAGPVGVEGADGGEYAIVEGAEECEGGGEAFWVWTA